MTDAPTTPERDPMDAWRDARFARFVAERLKAAPNSPQAVLQEVAAQKRALAAALRDPSFRSVLGNALAAEQQRQLDPSVGITPAESISAMLQVIDRRAPEAEAYAAKALDPNFSQPLLGGQVPIEPSLADIKHKETVADLLRGESPQSPNVKAHIDAIRTGMLLEHAALGNAFAKEEVSDALRQAMQAANPALPQQAIAAAADDWLSERITAARTTVAELHGPAYQEALRISEAYHAAKLQPAPTIAAPAQHAELAPAITAPGTRIG